MTDYIAIDRNALLNQLGRISDELKNLDIDSENLSETSDALKQINHLMHSMNKDIDIEERAEGYHINVSK